MIVVKLYGGKIFEVEDELGRLVAQAITATEPPKFVAIDGQTVAVADITGIWQWEKYKQLEGLPDVTPEPMDDLVVREPGHATAWKWEQFQELSKRMAERMQLPLEKRQGQDWYVWLETEAEFRAVMAGEQEWPMVPIVHEDKPGMNYRWVRKFVTDRQFQAFYAGRPGYKVLEVVGTDVAVAFKKTIPRGGWAAPWPPGTSWANAEEVAKLEA